MAWPRGARRSTSAPMASRRSEPGPSYGPPDRGGAARHHAPYPPYRPRLDPHFPGCPGVAEAGRGPHGQRQGRARVLGVPGEAGPHHVRARRRAGNRWRRRRSISPRRSCRSTRASSRVSAKRWRHEGQRCQGKDRRRAEAASRRSQQGGVQSALPEGERPAREHDAGASGAARYRADQDHPGRACPGAKSAAAAS